MLTRNPMLAVRDGRLFLAAQALDSLAIGLAGVALPWLVLNGGGSHAEAGLVFSVTVVPYLLLGLTAGAVGDRLPRRSVMLWSHAAQAVASAVIPLWAITGSPPVGVVLAAAFAVGAGRVFVDAAAFGAVASIVGAERFVDGQAAVSAAWSIGLFAGPALGGALVAAVGPAKALAAEAGALTLASLLVAAVRTGFVIGGDEPMERASIREGLRFVARDRGIATFTAITVIWNLFGAGAFALLVPLLRDHAGLDSGPTGAILAVGSVATLGSSLVAGRLTRRFGGGPVVAACFLGAPLAIAALGVASAFPSALAAALPYMLAEGLISVLVISERQRRAPERLQGRVGIAGRMLLLGAVAAGSALASALSAAIGLGQLYLVIAAATLAVGLAGAPLLVRLDD